MAEDLCKLFPSRQKLEKINDERPMKVISQYVHPSCLSSKASLSTMVDSEDQIRKRISQTVRVFPVRLLIVIRACRAD